MRICLFTPNFLPAVGGTELVTDALARQFHAKGHEAVVLALGKPAKLDTPYPVHWYRKPVLPRLWPERIGRRLAQLHRQYHFDIVAANYGCPTGYAALRRGLTTVVISHGGDLYRSSRDRRRPHMWKRTLYAYRHADGLIAISPYVEALIRQINPAPKRLQRIPNGIDLDALNKPAQRPSDFDEQRPFILCLGNLGPMKGFSDAIAAYKIAQHQLGGMALLIVGSGELDSALRRQVHEAELGEHVIFAGKRTGNDKRWFLRHCQFGLMPSIEEGHPIVGLEFLAMGKPLVCSTNEAFDGMYDEGVNSFRVPAGEPGELAQAMVNMGQSDRRVMGEVSRRRARDYAWGTIADRYVAFFERVVGELGT